MGFVVADIECWQSRLTRLDAGVALLPRRPPIGQLVKSMTSGRNRDEVPPSAYDRTRARFRAPGWLIEATPAEIEQAIAM